MGTTTRRPASTAATTVQPVMPFSINSIRTGDYVEKTAGLETIPFSRVVAVQSRRTDNSFSPLMTFPELLELLTRKGRAVRMIPIPVSKKEARYIESQLRTTSPSKEQTLREVESENSVNSVIKKKDSGKKEGRGWKAQELIIWDRKWGMIRALEMESLGEKRRGRAILRQDQKVVIMCEDHVSFQGGSWRLSAEV